MKNNQASSSSVEGEENLSPDVQVTVGEWQRSVRRFLQMENPAQDNQEMRLAAQVLLAHVLQKNRAWVLAHSEAIIEPVQQVQLDGLFERLCLGVPLPYLMGRQAFFGLDFEVNPDVLIPRPETELLVEHALDWLRRYPDRRQAADVGTGSGCIAASLAVSVPDLFCVATDRSWQALQVARRNFSRHQVADRVRLLNADLLAPCSGPFDLVCANLPYIPREILQYLAVRKYEPVLALDGGEDGLGLIRALLASAPGWLAPGGLILVEMQFDQGERINHLAKTSLPASRVRVISDLAGKPRLVEIEDTRGEPSSFSPVS